MSYRAGAFVNLVSNDSWRDNLSALDALTGLQSIELLVEQVPAHGEIRELEAALRGMSVSLHAPYVGVSLASHSETLRAASVARVLEVANMATQLSADAVTVHAGVVGAWESRESYLPRLVASLRLLQSQFAARICIENMPARGGGSREPLCTIQDVLALVEQMAEVSITLDTGHVIQSSENVADWVNAAGDHIQHVHLHDARRGGAGHLPLGHGDLDLRDLQVALVQRKFSGSVCLETLSQEDTALSWKVLRNEMAKVA